MKDKAKSKERLDNLLVGRAMFPSRESARTAIMDGAILVNGQKVTKAGTPIAEDATIEIIKSYNLCPYVSRGGLKLERALAHFQIAPKDRTAIDAGASTGGFTDCLLKNGATLVYAIDVGYGQLDWSLRQDNRVKVYERVNIRNMTESDLYAQGEKKADLAVMDVSFISVTKTLPALIALLDQTAYELVVLIKPQFEAGRGKVGKGGVVRDIAVHIEVLDKVISFIQTLGAHLIELTYSPIKGPSGNIEYLLHLRGGQTISTETGGADGAPDQQVSSAALAEEKAREAFASLGAP